MKTNNVDFGKSFNFRTNCQEHDLIYTCGAVDGKGKCVVSWDWGKGDGIDSTEYNSSSVKEYIKDGGWIVLPSDPVKLYGDLGPELNIPEDYTHECIAKLASWVDCMSYNDSYFGEPAGWLKSTIRQLDKTYKGGNSHSIVKSEDNLLDTIKAFTASSNHSIFIHEGKFEVYQAGLSEYPYKCKDDEQLMDVMKALTTLDKVLSND